MKTKLFKTRHFDQASVGRAWRGRHCEERSDEATSLFSRFLGKLGMTALIALAIVACKEDDVTQQGDVKIELIAPDATKVVRPADLPLTFEWKTSGDVGATTLYISTDAAFPEGAKTLAETVDALTYSLTADKYNALLLAGTVPYGGQTTVHWKVKAGNTEAASSFKAYRGTQPTLTLQSPESGADYNLNDLTETPVFTWTQLAEVSAYTVKFSTGNAFPAGATTKSVDVGNSGSYTFASVGDFNDMLAELGIGIQKTTVYWTVEPTTPNSNVKPATPRSFTVVRPSVLITSYDAEMIVPNDKQGNFTLEWRPQNGVSSYQVVIARNESLTDVVEINGTTGTAAFTVPYTALQTLIEDPTKNFKRYKKNELYWNVKANGAYIAETPGRVKLYGQRLFVDRRADWIKATFAGDYNQNAFAVLEPPQTYKVAVIEYGDKEWVWLAEDLRATSSHNRWGTDAQYSPAQPNPPRVVAKYRTNDDPCTFADLPAAYLNRTDPPIGKYYEDPYLELTEGTDGGNRILPCTLIDGNKVVVYSWRLPTAAEWAELFQAAVAKFGDDKALRHPAFISGTPPAHANAWGMNFLGNGYFPYGGNCIDGLQKGSNGNDIPGINMVWNETDIYYQAAGGMNKAYKWTSGGGSEISGNGNNIRAIYTGDGE